MGMGRKDAKREARNNFFLAHGSVVKLIASGQVRIGAQSQCAVDGGKAESNAPKVTVIF